MVSRTCLALLAVGTPLLLSACGTDTTDRTVSGAGIGAATGAVVGAVTPLTPAGGALIGAAVGGATGALTTPSDVNLGRPVWRQSAYANPPPPRPGGMATVDPATVRNIQAELQRRGYDVGPVDGRLGPRTAAAIRAFEQRNGLPVDGYPSSSLMDYMQSHPTG
jgi:peptidoglycan hydrolase-like protein with peptidoglycan-binding domain